MSIEDRKDRKDAVFCKTRIFTPPPWAIGFVYRSQLAKSLATVIALCYNRPPFYGLIEPTVFTVFTVYTI